MNAQTFGHHIATLRITKGLTIRELERLSGVSNAYISLLENGNRDIPSPEILMKLSIPLGVEYLDLMNIAGYLDVQSDADKFSFLEQENRELKRQVETLKTIIKSLASTL